MGSEILSKEYHFTLSNRVVMAIPVRVIAEDRARYFAHEFAGDVARSLMEDTIPMFEGDDYEIEDWARNNMDWKDVKKFARVVKAPDHQDELYQEGWMNPESVEIVG